MKIKHECYLIYPFAPSRIILKEFIQHKPKQFFYLKEVDVITIENKMIFDNAVQLCELSGLLTHNKKQ